MKAIRIAEQGGPEVLRLEEVADPIPGPGELLVDVQAIGVNFIDIYQREGLYQMSLPYTPGSEAAGTVAALGDGVTGFAVGDTIVSPSFKGAYAERAVVPAERAVHVPNGIDHRVAVAACLQGLTAHYLSSSTYPLQPGDKCLVHAAAGGVGLLLCQMAHRRGAFVIGTASTKEKLALAKQSGASEVIDYATKDFVSEVMRITNGEGVDVVFDSVGKTTFTGSLDSLHPRGMMVLFGQSSGPVGPIDPQILNKKGSLYLTRPTLNDYIATRAELEQRSNEVFGWVDSHEMWVQVGAQFSLAQAAQAHRAIAARATTGKVVLVPNPDAA